MSRWLRWAWNGLTALSLLLCVASASLGLLSRFKSAELHVYPGSAEAMGLASGGVLMFRYADHDDPAWSPPDDDPRILGLPFHYGLVTLAPGEVAPDGADGTQ